MNRLERNLKALLLKGYRENSTKCSVSGEDALRKAKKKDRHVAAPFPRPGEREA